MKTYVVYNHRSGKIVHAHSQSEKDRHKPEEILRLVHPSVDRSQLGTLEIEAGQMPVGKAYRVNPESKKLEAVEAGATSSSSVKQFRGGPHPY